MSRRSIKDLKRRGMLDDTLIVWAGEFGRTPMSQGGNGRDHHMKGFSHAGWPAAASRAASPTARPTSFGYNAVENVVQVHDLHATMLHLLGIDHERLTFQLPGPRLPPDRRAREGGEGHLGLKNPDGGDKPRRSPKSTESASGGVYPRRLL